MSDKKKKDKGKKKFLYIEPPNVLRQKVGTGGVNPGSLIQAEGFIDSNRTDFIDPYALDIMKRIAATTAAARYKGSVDKKAINSIAGPIMEMKANGAMFKYPLSSEIAAVMLNFLEGLQTINDDAFHIMDVHYKTLDMIFTRRLSGDGGKAGQALANELYEACRRYEKKYPPPLTEKPMHDN